MASRKLIIVDIILAVLGVILLVVGLSLFPVFDKKIKESIEKNVRLENSSEGFNTWKEPPAPIYISFYFFNVSNAEDIIKNGSKPILKEFGPFTYREYRKKTDIDFYDNGDKIRYREHKYYTFDRDSSAHNETFEICTLNIPMLTIATQVRFHWYGVQLLLADMLEWLGESLFQCHSVQELLWGYTPKSVKEVNDFMKRHRINIRINFTFGIYSGPTANGTDTGDIDIYTGVGDIKKLGLVDKWNGNSSLPFWRSYCNKINGSDGTIWHPFVDTSQRMYVFNTDVCRSIYLTYSKSVTTSSSGITTYRFTPPTSVMADPRTCPDNRCFCSPYDANGTFCLRAGVLNVSMCRQDAPIVMSQPHFFEAPDYVHGVIGMHPDAAVHQTILDVEPFTGVTLNASKRIQVNMYVQKLESYKDTKHLNNSIVFPISWVDEHAAIPDDEAKKFYRKVILPMKIADGVKYGLVALGSLLLFCFVVILIVILVKRRRTEKLEVSAEPDERTSLLSS